MRLSPRTHVLLAAVEAALLLVWALDPGDAATTLSGQAKIVDGDTLEIHGTRIALHGIDAPELGQACFIDGAPWSCGRLAKEALRDEIGDSVVICSDMEDSRFRRVLAVCTLDGRDLGRWMVRQGWALSYRQHWTDYNRDEAVARQARLGVWRGEFRPPWDWRKNSR
ncbi:MAG: thermonuclease family protein [Rhodospirillales bacterium]|nr:thermonuclease family protein [Rhodospirillales bacterium]